MVGNDVEEFDSHRSRPRTEQGYGIPDEEAGMLSWTFVREQMANDEYYWICTNRPDGHPHARPVWGVWVDNTVHCGGGERTRWVRNLQLDSRIVVHRESGEAVVIIEGTAERVTDTDLEDRLDSAYQGKYGIHHGAPFFTVQPETVYAWSDYPNDATKWQFG
ncbi:pyridoxamine 5'-phosphate oxidase-related FMN- binding protein [Haladaptatus paucihalophilus DX253]|uniref:Pyridoxamine 5'-phosphate oxidase n=1 Tax=Haladaptatus paucihalophilus DX253 TaxID=797209 RepID=E7QQP6_HALPU|nr:pyridoxamine 5'-phosphate oxidase family protein [Haladaptatus paucihalophilus]EFW93310.1 pyridoxamine 5'-phosphate oxidase-related FMN- binding protein [Haladaptatus paucihalophilus DX253]SHK50985.1 Pyridoxamine 5'-phosphate oxidase [Haladaptatus paucihalophilus DX253]